MTKHWAAVEPPSAALGPATAVRTSWDREVLVVHVDAHLDAQAGRQVALALSGAPGWSRAVLDLESVLSLDQDGLSAVFGALARAQQQGGELVIATFDAGTVQTLLGHGIGLVAPIVATVTDALRLLRRPPVPTAPTVWAASHTSA
jgi:anti-anti-sigma regulatory factor